MIPYAASIFKAARLLFRMALTLDDVKRVAHLARLAVNEDEIQAVHDRLTGIFGLLEQMQAVDTRGIEPMSHALDLVQRLRADKVTERDQRSEFQEIAPQVEGDLYLVPKVIE